MKRIFYQISGEMECSDCNLIKETSDMDIYRILNKYIKAIKYNHSSYKDSSKILFYDNKIQDIKVSHVQQKDKQYEQYIVGRDCSVNNYELDTYGEFRDNFWISSNNIKVKINDATVAVGKGSIDDNYWDWSIVDTIDTIKTSLHKYSNISDFYGGKQCIVVRSDDPINSVGIHHNE